MCRVCVCVCAGELVVDQLIAKYGAKRSAWPKKLLKNLEGRNAALTAAITERVGFVPAELFWPLGLTAKELITSREGVCLLRRPDRVFTELSGVVLCFVCLIVAFISMTQQPSNALCTCSNIPCISAALTGAQQTHALTTI